MKHSRSFCVHGRRDVFSYEGKYWQYRDVSIGHALSSARILPCGFRYQAARNRLNSPRVTTCRLRRVGPGTLMSLQEDIVQHYAHAFTTMVFEMTPDHLCNSIIVYVADSKEQAIREPGALSLFHSTLFSHGSFTETSKRRIAGTSVRQLAIMCVPRTGILLQDRGRLSPR